MDLEVKNELQHEELEALMFFFECQRLWIRTTEDKRDAQIATIIEEHVIR